MAGRCAPPLPASVKRVCRPREHRYAFLVVNHQYHNLRSWKIRGLSGGLDSDVCMRCGKMRGADV